MIETGKDVSILASKELKAMKLSGIAGRTGVIAEDLTDPLRKNRGYMIRLSGTPYLGEYEWFIPMSSVHEK